MSTLSERGQRVDGAGEPVRVSWTRGSILVATGVMGVVGAMYLASSTPAAVHAEGGPIEWLQLGIWAAAVLITGLVVARGPTRMDRIGAGWVHLIAWLAIMRELDMHLLPSPENLGALGMHFRTRWWLDFDVPLAPKLLWGIIGLALAVAIAVPVWMYGRQGLRLLRARDAAAVLMIVTMVFCFGGFAADDLLRHPRFIGEELLRGIEESLELLGALAFAGVGVALMARAPSLRVADATGGGARGVAAC